MNVPNNKYCAEYINNIIFNAMKIYHELQDFFEANASLEKLMFDYCIAREGQVKFVELEI